MDTSRLGRWQDVKSHFDLLVECPPEDRPSLLATLSGGDDAVRAELESLLAADERAAAFMDQPATQLRQAHPQQIGPYRLIREIGRGGMGSVYLAWREREYSQLVAIKMLRGAVSSAFLTARLLEERQMLATLDHPNIARLLDGSSTPDGVPYLVVEYVDGLPIDEYCSRHALPVIARIELILGVCSLANERCRPCRLYTR